MDQYLALQLLSTNTSLSLSISTLSSIAIAKQTSLSRHGPRTDVLSVSHVAYAYDTDTMGDGGAVATDDVTYAMPRHDTTRQL